MARYKLPSLPIQTSIRCGSRILAGKLDGASFLVDIVLFGCYGDIIAYLFQGIKMPQAFFCPKKVNFLEIRWKICKSEMSF